MRSLLTLTLIVPLLAGCASLSQEECKMGDWASVGTNDAMEGRTTARLEDHLKACAKYDIVPDEKLYNEGYQKGLITYCTPANGFSVGRNGYSYQHICSPASEPEFMRGFMRGSELHEVETEIAEKEREISRLRRNRDELMANRDNPKAARRLGSLRNEMEELKWDLGSLRFKRDRALLEADRFLQSIDSDI